MRFELAVEFEIPESIQEKLPSEKRFRVFRYEIAIGEIAGSAAVDHCRDPAFNELKSTLRAWFPPDQS